MLDRLVFKKTVLDNGITVYGRQTDDPFAIASIYVPVGHIHNTGGIIPGTAHFLEHMACNRSVCHPEPHSFKKFISFKGAECNAWTSDVVTCYWIKIQERFFSDAFRGLIGRVFHPILDREGITNEVGIISSERRQKNRWYPSKTELGYHRVVHWKYDYPCTLRQRLGEDCDLEIMDVDHLLSLHHGYFDPRTFVLVIGGYNEGVVFKELSLIKTAPHHFHEHYEPLRWARREYHEIEIADSNECVYYLGGIVGPTSFLEERAVSFIGNFLVNSVHGVLFDWLRRELRYSYGLRFNFEYGNLRSRSQWELGLHVGTRNQAVVVRAQFRQKIEEAIKDEVRINQELERVLAGADFYYQTIGEIEKDAESNLLSFGRIITETEYRETIRQCAQPKFLQYVYDKYWSPDVTGEFLAVPKGS